MNIKVLVKGLIVLVKPLDLIVATFPLCGCVYVRRHLRWGWGEVMSGCVCVEWNMMSLGDLIMISYFLIVYMSVVAIGIISPAHFIIFWQLLNW